MTTAALRHYNFLRGHALKFLGEKETVKVEDFQTRKGEFYGRAVEFSRTR